MCIRTDAVSQQMTAVFGCRRQEAADICVRSLRHIRSCAARTPGIVGSNSSRGWVYTLVLMCCAVLLS